MSCRGDRKRGRGFWGDLIGNATGALAGMSGIPGSHDMGSYGGRQLGSLVGLGAGHRKHGRGFWGDLAGRAGGELAGMSGIPGSHAMGTYGATQLGNLAGLGARRRHPVTGKFMSSRR